LSSARAAVDREGHLLRLSAPEPDGGLVARVIELMSSMGYVAEAAAEEVVPDRWYQHHEVDELSAEEASVLARRWVDSMSSAGVVPAAQRLFGPLSAVLLDTFRRAARTGIIEDIDLEDPRLRSALPDVEWLNVREWLLLRLGVGLDQEQD